MGFFLNESSYNKIYDKVSPGENAIEAANHVAFIVSLVNFMEKKGMTTDSVAEAFDNNIHMQRGVLSFDCNNLSIDSTMFTEEGNRLLAQNYKRWLDEFRSSGSITLGR
jgi:hypothetical protein